MLRCNPLLPAVFAALVHTPAAASEAVVAANLAASGGAASADPEDNAAVTANPGLLGLYDRYDLHGQFVYGPDGVVGWGASAADTRTSKWLDLGFHYAGDKGNPPPDLAELPGWKVVGEDVTNIRQHHQFTLAAAGGMLQHRLALGLSGTLVVWDFEHQGRGSTADLDAGLGARPAEWLDLGVAGRNLLPVGDATLLPPTATAGARLHGRPGALLADATWRSVRGPLPWSFAAGGELPLGEVPRLRLGWRYDGPDDLHKVTGGVGAHDQAGSIDLAAQVPVGPGQPTLAGLAFLVSITLHAPTADEAPDW